ncbi:hypothetical protein K3495_g16478 [Podosphaera aphanis]|nr:hypothetical protein K3495_g16478 [Podosphaera aphanis]
MFDNQIPVPKLDADGDTKMGGVNAIKALQAAINALKFNSHSKDKSKPRAKWRSQEEFTRLVSEGKCIRCKKNGHASRSCPEFRPALKPAAISHVGSLKTPESSKIFSKNVDEDAESDDQEIDGEISGEE